MLSLEQVRQLEGRVSKALSVIDALRDENNTLRQSLSGYEQRVKELEILIREYQRDQGRIEEGILSALERLNSIEDSSPEAAAPAVEAEKPNAPQAERVDFIPLEEKNDIDEIADQLIQEDLKLEPEASIPAPADDSIDTPPKEKNNSSELDIF
jgi:chromosome segregation ATPase